MNHNSDEEVRWFQLQVRELEGPLIRYTKKLTRDTPTAKDIVQESFLKLWAQDYAQVEHYVRPWLYQVCRHHAFDVLKRRGRQNDLSLESMIAPEDAPEDRYQKKEILHEIEKLKPLHREVLILKFQDGLTYKEIHQVTELGISHIGVLIHEAMRILRKKMSRENES